ncbi:D-ribose pyranase [Neobacillus notoginsengisoli]|uniref:D-ribose pyranase n=1 Tax=Neobacillus notoginsengisoli TaxID=1578198 RepID=A0A417YYH6_9BACI|nr:D-ribose pyranase [Neobacillus notoginsengisoli]RHW42590.1 D-ribose pyranase [Neobacillus notoginsengisoli]
MKKNGILNSHISKLLSDLGHTDTIVIADCGLPIPDGVRRIDLALKMGSPGFLETLEELLKDMAAESATIAAEINEHNPEVKNGIEALLGGLPISSVSHEEFKELTKKAKAIIRTGEATPYANIILHAGVIF